MNDSKQHCTNCQYFAWWDGDYCCTAKMIILQNSDDGKLNKELLGDICEEYIMDENPIYENIYE